MSPLIQDNSLELSRITKPFNDMFTFGCEDILGFVKVMVTVRKGISYDDYRLAMKGKKDLHFVCARCYAPDNGEEDADDILGAPTLTREDNVSEAEDVEEMEEPPVLELSVPMSENMASFHLSLEKGQHVKILQKSNESWWWAELNGCQGYVPVNHLTAESPQQAYWQDEEYFGSYSSLKLHHEMLSDRPRTLAYQKAIQNNARYLKDKIIIDVGCGTGIISMMCARHAEPRKVYAVEASNIVEHTREVIKYNKLDGVIEVMKDYAEDIVLDERVDLIVSEWMGTILLFEMMIESIIILRNKLLKDSGTMWPSSASLFLVPCSAHAQYSSKMEFWDSQFGFDFSVLKSAAKEDLISKPVHDYVIPVCDILSEPVSVLRLNLNTVSVEELEENQSEFIFSINQDGVMHGFCMWFEVEFCPLGSDAEPVSLNTGPYNELTHWKQNLFILDKPVKVSKGDRMEGLIKIYRHPEWRRHLRVLLQFKVFSGYQLDIEIDWLQSVTSVCQKHDFRLQPSDLHAQLQRLGGGPKFIMLFIHTQGPKITEREKLFYVWR